MLLSPNADFIPFAQSKRDSSLSPCRASTPLFHRTPPNSASSSLAFNSPMHSPSPLRRQALPPTRLLDEDDVFQSPLRAYSLFPQRSPPGPPDSSMLLDDDDIFLGPSPSSSSFIPPSSPAPLRTPLRTPVKDLSRDAFHLSSDCPSLSVAHLNVASAFFSAASAGTKRKPTPGCTTPSRSRTMTPLNITSMSGRAQGPASTSLLFDRLAPLSAPRFASVRETPQTKAETELHLKKQAETMTMLSIRDLDRSDDESGYDSDPDAIHNRSGTIEKQRILFMASTGGSAAPPFSSIKARTRTKGHVTGKSPGLEVLTRKGLVNDEEVVEAISPGGHVTKRRARSRPVSAELLDSVHGTPVVSQDKVTATPRVNESKSASTVAFPSTRTMRTRTISNSSTTSSESGSPRRRPNAAGATRTRTQSHTSRTLNRLQSSSSATLFFGPSIGPSTTNTTKDRKSSRTSSAKNKAVSPLFLRTDPHPTHRPQFPNRHSYAGSGSPSAWASRSPPAVASSPAPINARKRMESDCSDDEADLFFSSGPADSSFAISLQRDCTPSPKKKQKRESLDPLPKKFRPRDSGVVLSDSDDDLDLAFDDHTNFVMAAMPRASTSVSTMASSFDDHDLVTPGIAPSAASGWPTVVNLDDDHLSTSCSTSVGMGRSVDAFILRTLAAGGSVSTRGEAEPKRVPGTPVKKVKTAHLVGGVTRPWQSAVAHKIGFKDFDDVPGKGKGKPRKSLPAAFPGLGRPKETKTAKKERRILPRAGASERDADVDLDDGDSPTVRRDAKYDGLGLGRPTTGLPPLGGKPGKAHWLMRRSSSGAFSTVSDASSVNATPTRLTPKEWMLPAPRVRTPGASPLKNALEAASRSTSGSSTSTSTVTNSPTVNTAALPSGASSQRARKVSQNLRTPAPALFAALNGQRPHTHAHPARQVHAQPAARIGRLPAPTDEEAPGRFLRDFVEVDELGSGEFGRAMKVRYKDLTRGNDVFAVKKSKRFEGVKHRLRLREEVDILKHLSDAAARSPDTTVRLARRHPNILGYIDSWEEDETLYIQTELCELGNFAHFLWEYGRAFPRLDEARVWKIMAELAAGLRFIHDVNVIHLDLKPANIFLTGEGRLKIGDFGMASVWPRPSPPGEPQLIPGQKPVGFEREGDKLYLAPEVLQGRYGKAADVFSLGMTMLEAASNIVVPDQGEAWHRLRREDFCQVELDVSPELWDLIKSMMRAAPALRIGIQLVDTHPVVIRARRAMERMRAQHGAIFGASPLGAVPAGFLDEILARGPGTWDDDDDDWEMDLSS
uniref:Map kinase n=1 Tax=Ganoderma boninense TaxID=34458 RepID=A0A5K1JZQ7_9APHY|nr:Map kinase [Ganoderma boninense]